MTVKIALPTTQTGLEAPLSAHFGHATQFTIIDVDFDKKAVLEVKDLVNPPHSHGGCAAPVEMLQKEGVTDVILGGIGFRPLNIMMQLGMRPYRGVNGTIQSNLDAFLNGSLENLAQASCNHSNNDHSNCNH
jgi:predicted Fe-Mo cluster-binding NifX family protein